MWLNTQVHGKDWEITEERGGAFWEEGGASWTAHAFFRALQLHHGGIL